MSRKYKFRNQDQLYFVTFSVIYWIDVFIRNEYKDELIESLKYCMDNKGLEVYGYCIMTSHMHIIIGTHGEKMEDILRDFKSYTSSRLRKLIQPNLSESRREWMLWMMERAGTKNKNNNGFQFWQQHNNPIELYNNELMDQKLEYIHNNPVEAGFVSRPEDYVYSSARNYCGEQGILEVKIIE